jgi:hypothetical protein
MSPTVIAPASLRPVVGGVFLRLLYDSATWKKWASRRKAHGANWAPLPLEVR